MGGRDNNSTAYSLDFNDFDEISVTGHFENTVNLDPLGSGFERTSTGGRDIYIARYNKLGHLQWAETTGSAGDDFSYAVKFDTSMNIFLAGSYWNGQVDNQDIYFSKFNSSGSLLWVKFFDKSADIQNDFANSIALDSFDNVYLKGSFDGIIDLDPGAGFDQHIGRNDFLIKFSNQGDYIWGLSWGARSIYIGKSASVMISQTDDIYLSGAFSDTVDLDPGTGVDERTALGQYDIYLTRLDTDGSYVWCRTWGVDGANTNMNGTYCDNLGDIYTSGCFSKEMDFDPGVDVDLHSPQYDRCRASFLMKLHANGYWE